MHFETFQQLSSSTSDDSFWGTIIAPYLAESIFNSSKAKYDDISQVPRDVMSFENTLTTILFEDCNHENNSNPNQIRRMYLWFGTREQAKSCNASGIDTYNGKYVIIQTILPEHDVEFYDRYEIIQDSDPLVGGMYADKRINKILTSSPRGIKELSDDVRIGVIQDAVEKIVESLMNKVDKKQMKLIAIYETKRIMRRGSSTIFEDHNILLGDASRIRELGEEDDGSDVDEEDDSDYISDDASASNDSDASTSETEDSTADHAEATDFLMRKLHSGLDSEDMLEESDESDDASASDDSDESGEFTYDERVDRVVDIHNKLVPFLDDIESNKDFIIPLLNELHSIGHIDASASEGSDESDDDAELDPMPDLEDVFNHFSIKLTTKPSSTTLKESDKVEEVLEQLD
jgi:hypothetical protein